jgi:hypothetical protein
VKVICAWCSQEIEDIPYEEDVSDFTVSHGICKSCEEYFFTDRKLTLDRFLDRLDAPVLMVNPQGEVVSANEKALQFLDKDLDAVSGLRGGEVMECVYARLPGGCGNTVHCAACTIRRNVMETFETGKGLRQVPAFLNRQGRNAIHKIRFLISTEKVDDVVLLRIDEVMSDDT